MAKKSHSFVEGTHVYGNLYGVGLDSLRKVSPLKKIILAAVDVGNLSLLKLVTAKFEIRSGDVQGVSIIGILEESHIALHTWPEARYVTLDIFSCGKNARPEKAFKYVVSMLKPERYKMNVTDRSY